MTIQGYTTSTGKGILLNANESSLNLPKPIREEIAKAVSVMDFNRYPDTACTALREQMAEILNLSPSQILFGNGSDQMLGLLIGTLCGQGKTLVVPENDFSMYDYYASLYGTNLVKDSSLTTAGDMILFSNPNNPTGSIRTREEIISLLESVSVPVVVDEAYMEFSDQSVIDLVDTYPNVYVTRTFSKAWRAAAIRCGYLVSSQKNISSLEPVSVPYSVNTMTQTAASVVLSHLSELRSAIRSIITERETLFKNLSNLGLGVSPSHANFLYIEDSRVPDLVSSLLSRGIQVRTWPGQNRVRITVGQPSENQLVLEAIREAL